MFGNLKNRRSVIKRVLGLSAVGAFPFARADSGSAAATDGYLSDGTGATARDLKDKLSDSISVKDFGAKGNGVADDSIAIQKAIDYVGSVRNETQGGTVYVPKGVYKISHPLQLQNKTSLLGEGISTVIRADGDKFRGDCMISIGPPGSNVFDVKIRGLRLHQNKASIGKSVVYSNSMNQLCGVFDVLIDGLVNTDGIILELGPKTDGPSVFEIHAVDITATGKVTNGIHSNVGGMILKVSHATIEAGSKNTITRGIFLEKDMLCGDSLHFEGCEYGLVFGKESLGGTGRAITANKTTGTAVNIVKDFRRGGVVLDCVDHRSVAAKGLVTLQNDVNGDKYTDNFVTHYRHEPERKVAE